MSLSTWNCPKRLQGVNLFALVLWSLAVLVFGVGCGKNEESVQVHGKVNYRGNPVPAGRVIIEPNRSQGNEGPRGYAPIKEGEFDTGIAGGTASVPGPVVLIVCGYDGVVKDEGMPQGKPLFKPYRVEASIEPSESVIDIEIQ